MGGVDEETLEVLTDRHGRCLCVYVIMPDVSMCDFSTCPCVFVPTCLFVYLYVCLCVYVFVWLRVYVYMCLFVYASICRRVYESAWLCADVTTF